MTRSRTPRGVLLLAVTLSLGMLSAAPPASALTTSPALTLDRTVTTNPFSGSSTNLRDNEGLSYVAPDDSLWIASDNDKAVFEIDPGTGGLKRRIARAEFSAAPEVGGGGAATDTRDSDLEAIAYDSVADVLYVFSGATSSVPAVFKLARDSRGAFQVVSWRGLPSEWTGAGFRPADGKLYVVNNSTFATYDYATGSFGPSFSVRGVTKVYGIDFTNDAAGDMFVATGAQRLVRVNLTTRSTYPGWTLDLTRFGMLDSRAVEVVGNRLFLADGYDFRPSGDALTHALFVFSVTDGVGGAAPVAAFTASAASGSAPLTVTFTDTSTGTPTSWAWDFGDGGTSTARNPSHEFTRAGTFRVTLTARNPDGATSASKTVTVAAATAAPKASFTASATSGTAPLTVRFTDTSTGAPTSWAWDFGDGGTSTARNPSHAFATNRTFTVKLTARNAGGATTASRTITLTAAAAGTTFTAQADTYVNTASPMKSYGAAKVLKLHSPNPVEYRPIVRFGVTGLSGAPKKAVLRLWVTDASVSGGTWYKVSNNWTESATVWSTKPTVVGAPVAGRAGAAPAGGWLEVNVTSAVTGNGQYSFEATSASSNTAAFGTKEGGRAPQLVVTR